MPHEPEDATPQDAPAPGGFIAVPAWPLPPPSLRCPLCAGEVFRSETIRASGENGMSTHYLDLRICVNCRYTYCFSR